MVKTQALKSTTSQSFTNLSTSSSTITSTLFGSNNIIRMEDSWVFAALTTVAVVGVTAIPLLQTDAASRIVCSATSLQQKRLASYKYFWEKETTRCLLHTLDAMGGDENLELLVSDEEVQNFMEQHCLGTKDEHCTPKIVAVGVDEYTKEVCVWILSKSRLYQLSLKQFGTKLAASMEQELTTTTLCFVADASAGLGTQVITEWFTNCKELQVPVIREPTWMAQFAVLVEDGLIMTDTLDKCLFSLCRLEARCHVKDAKSVCITLPGMATTAPLIAMLQRVFPCERHVFIYDGCAASVQRSIIGTSSSTGAAGALLRKFTSPIRHTRPLARSLSKQIPTLATALQSLSLDYASATESWMTAVNAMLILKESEKEYLPFCCKVSYLLDPSTRALAVQNLLEFMIGSRSRALPEDSLPKAIALLSTVQEGIQPSLPSLSNQRLIENAVFQHKSILLGNKTLLDTVLPSKEWSLKAAKKISGCSCCAPEEDDEEEEENGASSSEKPISANRSSTYVDGKAMFAFDPSKFG